jgi:steroid delta-isomerase-like uncharacterized protein
MEAEATTRQQLSGIAGRWIEAWQTGRLEILDELQAPDFFDHDPSGRSPDGKGFIQGLADLYAAFPDFLAGIEDLVIDCRASKVAVRWTASGTQRGCFLGRAASGRRIRFKGIEIIRIAGGKIQERWGEWDSLELAKQLDA